jgi:hypothetical protein
VSELGELPAKDFALFLVAACCCVVGSCLFLKELFLSLTLFFFFFFFCFSVLFWFLDTQGSGCGSL